MLKGLRFGVRANVIDPRHFRHFGVEVNRIGDPFLGRYHVGVDLGIISALGIISWLGIISGAVQASGCKAL